MKLLLHGEHIENSRNEFIRLKNADSTNEIRDLNGKQTDETALVQALESNSLFSAQVVVCIENLFSPLGKKTKTAERFASAIKNADSNMTILLWEQKEIGKEILSLLEPSVSVRLFAYPKVIFSFLDSLRPGNAKQTLELLDELLATEHEALVWSMTVSRIRVLVEIKDNVPPERMSSWQLSRLTNQARSFTMNKLLDMYTSFLNMEYSFKNGTSPYSLADGIRQIVVSVEKEDI